ncbi:MAG: copper resistance D family protein, partial [Mycobacteriales bacterium]
MKSESARPHLGALAKGGLALGAVALALGVTLLILHATGELKPPNLPGLSVDVGPTTWLLPTFRVLADASAVVTVGYLLAAVVFVPGFQHEGGRREGGKRLLLSPTGFRWIRVASWAAVAWAVTSTISILLTASDLLGITPGRAFREKILLETARSVTQGQTLAWTCAITLIVAVICRYARTLNLAGVSLLLAVAAITPVAFAGHSAGAGNHQLAVSGQILHVVPVTLWLGGLLALVLSGRLSAADRVTAVSRFSTLAGYCLVLVGASGLLSLSARLRGWSDLFATAYGRVALIKIAVLLLAGVLGAVHRAWCIPLLRDGRRRIFARIATVELLVLAVGMGAGVGLA